MRCLRRRGRCPAVGTDATDRTPPGRSRSPPGPGTAGCTSRPAVLTRTGPRNTVVGAVIGRTARNGEPTAVQHRTRAGGRDADRRGTVQLKMDQPDTSRPDRERRPTSLGHGFVRPLTAAGTALAQLASGLNTALPV